MGGARASANLVFGDEVARPEETSALELRQLECFAAVAEEGHFDRAAVRLHMSQPPLTRRIARLERDLDVTLFVRTHSGATLTAAGEALLIEARRILANTARAAEITRIVSVGAAGELIVGYYGSSGFDVVPRLLRAFSQAYPDIDVKIQQLPKTQQVDANEPIVVYPRARPSFADHVVQLFEEEEEDVSLNVVAQAEDVVHALVYVAIGRALAFVPRAGTRAALPDIRFLPVKGSRGLHVTCVHPEGDSHPALRSFLNFIPAWAEELDG